MRALQARGPQRRLNCAYAASVRSGPNQHRSEGHAFPLRPARMLVPAFFDASDSRLPGRHRRRTTRRPSPLATGCKPQCRACPAHAPRRTRRRANRHPVTLRSKASEKAVAAGGKIRRVGRRSSRSPRATALPANAPHSGTYQRCSLPLSGRAGAKAGGLCLESVLQVRRTVCKRFGVRASMW